MQVYITVYTCKYLTIPTYTCIYRDRDKFGDLCDEVREIFTIEAYGEDFGPFEEYRTDGLYDDEDDSNDEDNWRNDYPDEMNG